MVDARLPDGSRVNAVIPPLSIDGSALTIRKFAADPLTVHNLIDFGSISDKTADFLDACVRGRLNIIVSGSTGAGKTTTLNVLSSFIPNDERIVTIEDAAELQLKQDHVVRLESRPNNIEGKGSVTIVDGRQLVSNAYEAKRTAPLLVSGAVLHVLPAGCAFDLPTRTLAVVETPEQDEEVADLRAAEADLRDMAREIAAEGVSPTDYARRLRRTRGA